MNTDFSNISNSETEAELSGQRQRVLAYIAAHAEEPASRSPDNSGEAKQEAAQAADVLAPQRKFELPQGDAAQVLERQLACSTAMIAEVARSLVEEEHPVDLYAELMKSTSVLIGASALAARVAGELRGGGATLGKTNGV